MKKLLVSLSIGLMTIALNAASATWTVGDIYLQDGSGKAKAANTDYALLLLYSSSTTDLGYTINGANSLTLGSTVQTAYSGAMTGAGGTGSLGKTYDAFGND